MFQYTNTVILNKNLDSSGKAKWSAQDETEEVSASFDVKRIMKFFKDNVISIYKREAADPVISKVTFTPVNEGAGVYRVVLYMGLQNNNNAYYANDMVFKGKPLVYEFSVKEDDTATQIAQAAVKAINKIQSLFGDKYIKAEVSGSNLVINGTDEYQIFKKASIQKFDETVNSALVGGEFVTIAEALVDTDEDYDSKNTIENGTPGFGTYLLILKDLRLPTMEAIRFGGINQEELPILGAKYNQYTIHYCKQRGIMGSDAVGDLVKSKTTHVFYVNTEVAEEFETALGKVGDIETV